MNMMRDAISGIGVILDAIHHIVHLGKLHHIHASTLDASFDTGSTFDVMLIVGERPLHLTFEAGVTGGRSEFVIFEGVTKTGDGTAVNLDNNNREAPTGQIITTAQKGATFTGGTQIMPADLFATASGQTKYNGEVRRGEELILARNTKYVFRQTARADNLLATLDISCYER